jgi:DNA invertase Pin-like site-specific DNA recombinase
MARRKATHDDYPAGCVVAYLRVSTAEQATSGAGLDAQRAAIAAYAERTGLTVGKWLADEGVSASVSPSDRPALAEALAILAECRSGALLVSASDRLARKASDLLAIRDVAEDQGWTLSAANGSIDMATPYGRAMSTVMGGFAELERDLIRTRTRDALAAKKAAGARLGRKSQVPPEVKARIALEREQGRSLNAIANGLNADGVPTVGNGGAKEGARGAQGRASVQGARWYASTVAAVLRSVDLDAEAERLSREAGGG